jgi:thiol:disulfide interchange protein DsbD
MIENLVQQFSIYLGGAPLVAMAAAFAGGVLVSLTPCVYPVLPLTVAFIGAGSAGSTRMRGLLLSLVYVAGLALTYAALGVVSALANKVFGALSTSPSVLIGVGIFFLIFGLAMMDVIPLPLPRALTNLQPKQRAGFAGAFLVGVLSGLIAMPCSTPVLLAILTHIAQHGGVVYGFGLMFCYALGFGVLLIVVGASAGALTSLPKSGAWMNWTKRIAGLVIIAFGAFYLFSGARGLRSGAAPAASDESFIAVDGPEFLYKQIGDKPVVFVFFGSWCKVCAEEVPELNKLYLAYKDKGLAFYGVDITDTEEKAREFIKKHDVQYPVIWDSTQSKVAEEFKILSTPTIIIYDGRGKRVYSGADPPHALDAHIAKALGRQDAQTTDKPGPATPELTHSALLEITIIGDIEDPAFLALSRAAESFDDANKEIVLLDVEDHADRILETPYRPLDVPALFACLVDVACARPITDPDSVETTLRRFIMKFSDAQQGALEPSGGALEPVR